MFKDIAFPKHPPSTERRQGDSLTFTDADKLRAIIPALVLHAVTLFSYKKLLGVCRQFKFGKKKCTEKVKHYLLRFFLYFTHPPKLGSFYPFLAHLENKIDG